jgi:ABC-type sugar transport system substrate-binding protein
MPNQKVLYISPLPQRSNPSIDCIALGLQIGCLDAGLDFHVLFDDLRKESQHESLPRGFTAAMAAKVDAIIYYSIDPHAGRQVVEQARNSKIPVFSICRPNYPVNAALVYPGFNQGLFMMNYLTSLLPAGSMIGIIGGPKSVSDSEEVAGLVYGLKHSECILVNDPEVEKFSNLSDNREGAHRPVAALMSEFPKLDGVVPYNDETMLGVVEYHSRRGLPITMKMVSRNGSPAAVLAVREGKTTGTWDIDPPRIGKSVAALVARHLSGMEIYDDYVAMAPAGRMITRASIDSWQPWESRLGARGPRLTDCWSLAQPLD